MTLSEHSHTLLVLFVDIAKFVRPSLQIELCFLDPVDIQRASFSADRLVTPTNHFTNSATKIALVVNLFGQANDGRDFKCNEGIDERV